MDKKKRCAVTKTIAGHIQNMITGLDLALYFELPNCDFCACLEFRNSNFGFVAFVLVLDLGFRSFVLISDFDIRISCFPLPTRLCGIPHTCSDDAS